MMIIPSNFIFDLTLNTKSPLDTYENFESELLQANQKDVKVYTNNDKSDTNNTKQNGKFKLSIIKKNKSLTGSSRLFTINIIPKKNDSTDTLMERTQSNQNDIYIYIDRTKNTKQ